MCCLHNASIDEAGKGWCFGKPERLAVAKHAKRIVVDWTASNLADAIIAKAWNRMITPHGYAAYDVKSVRPCNRHLLFCPVHTAADRAAACDPVNVAAAVLAAQAQLG